MDLLMKLPEEAWVRIFGYLTFQQLKAVRLVCGEWNRIVRNSLQLLDKYILSIPAGCTVSHLQQLATAAYRNIRVQNMTVDMAPCLPLFDLRKLILRGPFVQAAELIRMLSSLPDLEQLTVRPATNFNYDLWDTMPTVQLNRLEKLQLHLTQQYEFLSVFERITCPSLRSFELKTTIKRYITEPYGSKLLDFIESRKCSLKHVFFLGIQFQKESLLRDLMAIEGLKLQSFKVVNCTISQRDIVHLCRTQNGIECLRLRQHSVIGISVLTSIAMHLPNLKSLQLTTEVIDLKPFLTNLPSLEFLYLVYGNGSEPLDLSDYRNLNLLDISLARFHLTSTSLLEFFKKSPNITNLSLYSCQMITVHDILVITGQLKNLRNLTVEQAESHSCPDYFANYSYSPFLSLRQLTLQGATIPINVIRSVLQNCPLLSHLTLARITYDELGRLTKFMKNVSTLCLESVEGPNGLSVEDWVEEVFQQCPKLELLRLTESGTISDYVT